MDGVVHFEIPALDMERAKKFYKESFGWNIVDVPNMDYTLANTAQTDQNGMIEEKGKINGGIVRRELSNTNSIVIVINVSNIDESIKRALEKGAKLARDKQNIPNVGIYAAIVDTEGNMIGLMQSARN